MPIFSSEEPDYAEIGDRINAAPTAADRDFASQYNQGLDRSLLSSTAALVGGSAVDLIDTVASSIVPGVERQSINNRALAAFGSPGLTKWVDENRGAMEVGSSILGVVVSNWAAGKLLNPAGKAMQMLRGVPYVRTIATLDRQYENAVRLAKITSLETAGRGAMGADRFIGLDMSLSRLGQPALQVSAGSAAKGVMRTGMAKGLVHNATTEAIMATTLHTNDLLYSDDLGHNLAWGAAGLGLGAGIDSLVTTHALRKIANSSMVRARNARAFDPSGLEGKRLTAFDTVDKLLRESGGDASNLSWMFHAGGDYSDEIVRLGMQASELTKPQESFTQRASELAANREKAATPIIKQAYELVNKITTRGVRGVKQSGFATGVDKEIGKAINQTIYREPTAMLGVEELGQVPAEMTRVEMAQARAQALDNAWNETQKFLQNGGKWVKKQTTANGQKVWVDELIPAAAEELEAAKKVMLELNHAKSFVPMTMVEVGEWAPLSFGQIADSFVPRKAVTEGTLGVDDIATWTIERTSKAEPKIGLSSQGDLYLPDAARGRPENLTDHEALHLFKMGNTAIRQFQQTGATFTVPKNPTWFQLDMAESIIKATDNPNQVKFAGGMTREEALVESFAQKIDIIKRKEKSREMAGRRGLKLSEMSDADAYAMKVRLNLPRLTSYQQGLLSTGESPLDILLHGFESGTQVRSMNHQELVKALNDARVITDFTDNAKPGLDGLSGNSFNFMLDEEGNHIGNIMAFKRPQRPSEFTRDSLFVRQALREANLRNDLLGDSADDFTRAIMNAFSADPAFSQARKVRELADDQNRSFVPGFRSAAPQTNRGAFMGSLTSRERRDIDSLTLRAASQAQELMSRLIQRTGREIIERRMQKLIPEISSQRNAKSKMLLSQALTFRPGWEIARKPVEVTLPDGTKGFSFVLDHESVTNQRRFEGLHGRQIQKGEKLLNPDGQVIVLDDLAMRTYEGLTGVFEDIFNMKNTVLRSQGLAELKQTPWYAPPPDTKNKFVAYTFDMANNVIPDMTVYADTAEDFAKLQREMRESKQWRDGYSIRTRDDAQSFMSLFDRAQMDFMAPNTTAIQPKKHNFGRSGGNQINMNAFEGALEIAMDSVMKHGNDLLEIVYDPVIKAAKSRAAIAKVERPVGFAARFGSGQHNSIYDRYLQNLLGRTSLSSKDSFWGSPYEWLEGRINGFLQEGQSRFRESDPGKAYAAMSDYIRAANPFGANATVGKRFDQFSQALGPYMPFKSASELIARETGSKTPKELADITNKLSWFEASSRLRWFESMHAMVNFGSMVANMPAVIRALQPLRGESAADAALRNSSLTMLMNLPNGAGDVVLPNSPKLLWQSMRDAQKALPDEFTTKAIQRGFMDQEVSEAQRNWNAIKSKGDLYKFVFGNPESKTRIGRAGLDGVLGALSDKSEAFTRQWGMYAGRRVAQAMGINGVDDQLNFAHQLTNQLIANYDPRNRAEIFQGALGAPLGLFQSYTVNFYQRMFRYIETGNTRALATQYATQGALFGGASVPGWNQLNWAFFDHQQGESNKEGDPIESLYARLGTQAGDLYLHGLISNLPKIFGQDGMALYTRGDTQFRMPVNPMAAIKGDALVSIPFTDTIGRVFEGISQAAAQFKAGDGSISMSQLSEIASNMITNRPIAGMIETFGANGFDTDAVGQVAAASRTNMESLYRILGTRSMVQQRSIEEFYANKNATEEQAARKEVLNTATRQAIRDGRYEEVPRLFAKYVEEGGSPNLYSSWVKKAAEAATHTRSERQLDKALRDPNNQSNAYIARLLDAGVDVAEADQDDEDYGRDAQIEKIINDGWETEPVATPPDPMGEPIESPNILLEQ